MSLLNPGLGNLSKLSGLYQQVPGLGVGGIAHSNVVCPVPLAPAIIEIICQVTDTANKSAISAGFVRWGRMCPSRSKRA